MSHGHSTRSRYVKRLNVYNRDEMSCSVAVQHCDVTILNKPSQQGAR